mgnify:FL=1
MHVQSNQSRLVPLLVIFACGFAGVTVDLFDILTVAIDGPRWLHQLDLLTAILLTVIIGGLAAYSARHHRTRGTTENSERNQRAD